MVTKLPAFLKPYFWDVDFEKIDPEKSKMFILKRCLDRGSDKAIKWLLQHYTKDDIRHLLLTSRDLSAKTANFWALYLNVNIKKVSSLKNPPTRKIPMHLTSEYLNRAL